MSMWYFAITCTKKPQALMDRSSGPAGLQAYSEVTDQERRNLEQAEVRGMQHLLALASRPDFHRSMLRDRKLTHPDLLQHCADGVQLPLIRQPDELAANDKFRRCLSRKLSSGGSSMQLLLKQASVKQGNEALQGLLQQVSTKQASSGVQSLDRNEDLHHQLIAVAYPPVT